MGPASIGRSLVAGIFVLLAGGSSDAAKPPLCENGRWAITGAPLIGAGGEIVTLSGRRLAIGSLCAERKAQLRRLKTGTRVKVKFKRGGCTGVTGKAKLSALISDNCMR